MRRSLVVGAAVVALSLVFLASVLMMAPPVREPPVDPAQAGTDMVTFEGAVSSFWPFLSPEKRFRAHSPVNVVMLNATVDDVVRLMGEQGWNRTLNESTDAGAERFSLEEIELESTNVTWDSARGAARYAYVDDGQQATWVRQTAQLHHGGYFTQRLHMRLYGSPVPGEWVAMQAHTEHFDWFTLRHAVDGSAQAQLHVEADFMDKPFVQEVWRKHLSNAGASDADGWATIIELALFPGTFLVGTLSFRRFTVDRLNPADRARLRAVRDRLSWDHLFLAAAMLTLVLGVRIGGLLLERQASGLSPYVIAALLFPVLVLGIPLAAYGFSYRMEHRMDAGLVAGASLALASMLDYGFLGVDVLPIPVVLHRAGVVMAVALIAAGAARRATRERRLNGLVVTGAALWTLLVAATLMGWV